MVFNKSIFKKMIKTAYKTCGLLVANKDGRIILAGGWWMMSVEEKWFPKWGMAAVIELTGEIPAAGESFRSTSAANQMELPNEFVLGLDDYYDSRAKSDPYHDTRILNDSGVNLARYLRSGKNIVAVNEMIMELYDPGVGEEGEPTDAELPHVDNKWVYWHTPVCSWACGVIDYTKPENITFHEKLGELLQEVE